jgi:hypothetical protein
MTPPKIDPDDFLLFGSLGVAALGLGLISGITTADAAIGVGVVLAVWGFATALIVLLAAGETK